MGPVAEALVVVALGLEELAEVGLAVDISVQRRVVAQADQ